MSFKNMYLCSLKIIKSCKSREIVEMEKWQIQSLRQEIYESGTCYTIKIRQLPKPNWVIIKRRKEMT